MYICRIYVYTSKNTFPKDTTFQITLNIEPSLINETIAFSCYVLYFIAHLIIFVFISYRPICPKCILFLVLSLPALFPGVLHDLSRYASMNFLRQ